MPSGKTKNKRDRYIGKIVRIDKCVFDYDKYYQDSKTDYCQYIYYSLFLVVGIKEKEYVYDSKRRNNHYILKPLENDEKNININKDLVWEEETYVNNEFLAEIVEIVD